MQASSDEMLAAIRRTALAARWALGQTGEAAAGCRGAADSALSAQGAALSAFQQDFSASIAQDQVPLHAQLHCCGSDHLASCS